MIPTGLGSRSLPAPQGTHPGAAAGMFRLCFQSGASETRDAMLALRAFLVAQGVSSEAAGTVELVLAEACNNVTEHAYEDRPGAVDLCVALDHRGAHCRIIDTGRPLPSGTPPVNPPDPPCALPEGGFGWYIIRSLSSTLDYRCEGGRNVLRLCIAL